MDCKPQCDDKGGAGDEDGGSGSEAKGTRTVDLKLRIPRPTPNGIRELRRFWGTTNAQLTSSDRHMYGEPTAGTIYKIWMCINAYAKPRESDVLLDWGMGGGKMLISKQFFAALPDMGAVGIEMDAGVFAIAQANLGRFKLRNTRIMHRDSSTVTAVQWAAMRVSIVIQYDGGTSPDLEPYHRTIMRSLVAGGVRVIFSTKMNRALFDTYFHDRPEVLLRWSLYRLPSLLYGTSRYMGHMWMYTE
jgi:hypothetical protein